MIVDTFSFHFLFCGFQCLEDINNDGEIRDSFESVNSRVILFFIEAKDGCGI